MATILVLATDPSAMRVAQHSLRQLLSTLAQAAVQRIPLRQRDLLPEFYRYPPI